MKLSSELKDIDVIFEVLSDKINKYDATCKKVERDFGWTGKRKTFICVNIGKREVYFMENKSQCETELKDRWGFDDSLKTLYSETYFFTTYEESLNYLENTLKIKELNLSKELEEVRNKLGWLYENPTDTLESNNLFMV